MRVRLPAGLTGFATLAATTAATATATKPPPPPPPKPPPPRRSSRGFGRLIHAQRATVQLLTVQGVDRRLGLGAVRRSTKPKPLERPSCGRKRRARKQPRRMRQTRSAGLIIRRIGKVANIDVHVSVLLSLLHSCHVCSLSGRTDSHGQNRSRRQPAYPARFTDVNLRQSQMWFPLECWKSQKDARTLNRTREAGVMTNPGFLASTLQKVTCRPVSGVSSITTN